MQVCIKGLVLGFGVFGLAVPGARSWENPKIRGTLILGSFIINRDPTI